jgi:hypothetical protein
MIEIPKFKTNCFGHSILGFGICLGFVIWDLEFETSWWRLGTERPS